MDSDWAWAGSDRFPGYCLTFIRGMTPAAVAQVVGGGDLRMLTAVQALELHGDHEIVRFGAVAGWAFCYDSGSTLRVMPDLRSRSPEIVQLFHGGDGTNIVNRVVEGRTTESFEPGVDIRYPAEGPPLLRPRVRQLLAGATTGSSLVAAAVAIGEVVGASVSEDDLDGALLTGVVRRVPARPGAPVISPALRSMLVAGEVIDPPRRDT
ncbi:hypothetical protein [Actinoplanes sp. HUAS TT8]|uniref:hypothetical protein n=1 Tax=Actinoplanes sp. HUAS TT8 TaxID=3447453 RepID=UPI003F52120C